MNCFDTFLDAICVGDVNTFSRFISDEFVNTIYTHDKDMFGVIKIELVTRLGHRKLRPLHLVSDKGHVEMVKKLMVYDCDIDASSKIGNRPIHMAASRGHWEIVALLLKQGCATDNVNKKKQTALHLAAKGDHIKVVKILLYAGSDLEKKDWMNCTAEQAAKLNGSDTIVTVMREWRQLKDVLKVMQRGRYRELLKQSNFKKFYIHNDICVDALLKYLKDVDRFKSIDIMISELRFYHYIRRHQNDDWLMHADIEAVNKILDEDNALVYCLTMEDSCPYFCHHLIQLILDMDLMLDKLHKIYRIVAPLSNKNITGIIVKRQYLVDIKIKALWNRLHLAVCDDRCDMIEYLIVKNKVYINGTDEIGNTPLFLACIYGHIDCARILLNYGADTNTTNKYGQSLLQVAIENGMEDFITPILDQINSVKNVDSLGHSALCIAIKFGSDDIVQRLIAKETSIDADISNVASLISISQDRNPNMPLSISSRQNLASLCLKVKGFIFPSIISKMSYEALQILDEKRNSLLHLAAWTLSFETCRCLITRGFDVNLRNSDGNTPLHEAISIYLFDTLGHEKEESLLMIVRVLIESGADINIINVQGQTALQLSIQRINEKLIRAMTMNAKIIVLQISDLDELMAKKHFILMTDLIKRMDPEYSSSIITEEVIITYAKELETQVLDILVNKASNNTRNAVLEGLLSSRTMNYGMVKLLHCLLQYESSFSTLLNGESVLTHFMKVGNTGVCEELIISENNRFFIDATNIYNQSPLHIASEHGFLGILELLLAHGAMCDNKDNNEDTPLGLLLRNWSACESELICRVETIAMTIIYKGANINCVNYNGETVIDCCQNKKMKKRLIAGYKENQLRTNSTLCDASTTQMAKLVS